MMSRALLKDAFREIKNTRSKFLSIMIIIMLGSAFFVGIKSTGTDMKLTADKYFDQNRLMDLRILSTIGFNDKDISAIQGTTGVLGVMPSYSVDTIAKINSKDLVVKVLALPTNKLNESNEAYINRPKLLEGRYSKRSGECMIEKSKMLNYGIKIGTALILSSGDSEGLGNTLKTTKYTVVGIVESPYYISYDRGSTSIGSGKVNSYIMVPAEDFKMKYYNDVFITIKGGRNQYSYSDKYTSLVNSVKNNLKQIANNRISIRFSEIKKEGTEKLNKSKENLALKKQKQNSTLKSARYKMNHSLNDIKRGEEELLSKERAYKLSVKSSEEKLAAANKQLEAGEREYKAKLADFQTKEAATKQQLNIGFKKLQAAQAGIDQKENSLKQLKQTISSTNTDPITLGVLITKLKNGSQQLNEAKGKLMEQKQRLVAGQNKLLDTQHQFENKRKEINQVRAQLGIEDKRLKESKQAVDAQLKAAAKTLQESKKKLSKAQKDYDKAQKKLFALFQASNSKIAAAEKDLQKFPKPVWYILDRNTNPGFVDYKGAADRMDAIAKVFPVFFFLIAALVCMTTMTRMVDDDRAYIGTIKALGYSKLSIASKYLIYSISASAIGSVLGIILGYKLFPTVISNAYGIMYTLPPIRTPLNLYYICIAISLSISITTLAVISSCYKDLMITPAALLRPKAPKPGKRIFLERIKLLWDRLSFIHKVTARNMFRYKKRLLMTVLGVAGCTALMLSGFGLKDSIVSIVEKQFNELYKYNMVIDLNNEILEGKSNSLINNIAQDKRMNEYMLTSEKSIELEKNGTEKSATLFVAESGKLKDFITLRNRISSKPIELTDNGVVLTEKLADKLMVSVGSSVSIKNGDTKVLKVKVEGITENYVSHYVYMTPKLYCKVYSKRISFLQILTKNSSSSEEFENKLSRDLLKNSDAKAISFTTGISKNFKDIVSSLNYIVIILIVSAGLLAFVVLYNLTNVNISERIREIATIKVLGFYDNEVSAYVYRENMILTILGMLMGLLFGIFLHRYIVVTAEVDYVMFGRDISQMSFLYAAVLTLMFSAFVNFVMYFKLKKVDMVQSLKSVD